MVPPPLFVLFRPSVNWEVPICTRKANFYYFIEILLIYTVVFVSAVQESSSVTHIYMCVCLLRFFFIVGYYKIFIIVPCARGRSLFCFFYIFFILS